MAELARLTPTGRAALEQEAASSTPEGTAFAIARALGADRAVEDLLASAFRRFGEASAKAAERRLSREYHEDSELTYAEGHADGVQQGRLEAQRRAIALAIEAAEEERHG